MTEPQMDAQGEARDALSSVVADFGPRVLSDPRMLGSRMSDLLPDLPKERQLLITAAEADVAGELTRHVQEQHLDANTAVQLVAGSLTDRKSIDPASSMWVATEYAKALGYSVQPGVMPPPSRPTPPPPPAGQETVTTYGFQDPTIGATGGYAGYGQPQQPSGAGGYGQPQQPAGAGGYYSQPQQPSGGGGYSPQQPAPGQAPPTRSASEGTPGWLQSPPDKPPRNRGRIYGFGAAAAAVVIILGVGFGTHWFGGSSSTSSSTSTTTSPTTHSRTTTPPPRPVSTVVPLVELLPNDIDDPASDCQPYPSPDWATTGLVKSYECQDPGIPPGNRYNYDAFQFNSYQNYLASWQALNKLNNFDTISKGATCPPPSGAAAGTTEWRDPYFPYRDGQVLECGTTSSTDEPELIWSYPTENAYVLAWGESGMSISSLNTWWERHVTPVNAPTPSP